MAAKKQKPPKFVAFLQEKLRPLLTDNYITVAELYENTGVFSIVSGTGHRFILDSEENHKIGIVPFYRNEKVTYWLSVNCSIKTAALKTICIAIYFDTNDNEQKKIFRAEWGNNDKIEHAQPHWHFHFVESNSLHQQGWQTQEVEEGWNKSGSIETYSDNFKRLHFSMNANWHKKSGHAISLSIVPDAEILCWVEGAITYIKGQLIYLENKELA